MTDSLDPGWRPAVPLVGRIVSGRGLDGSILLVMRAAVIFLGVAAALSGLGSLILGAGSQHPRIGGTSARILISLAMGIAAIGISTVGKAGPDLDSPGHLAVSVFRITMRRVLFAAGVGPAGLAISWVSGDASYVIFGTGLAILLMAVAAPTSRRLAQFQSEVVDAGSEISVLEALQRSYR